MGLAALKTERGPGPCPRLPLPCFQEYDPWKSSDRICRQLIYHLTPHSKWHQSGLPHRKSHSR